MELVNENWNKYYLKALYGLNDETKFAFFNKYYKNVLKEFTWFNKSNLPENTIERIKQVIKCMENGIIYDDGDFSNLKNKQTEMKSEIER